MVFLSEQFYRNQTHTGSLSISSPEMFSEMAMFEKFVLTDRNYYKQQDAVSMDSLLVHSLTNAFMCRFEISWFMENCLLQLKPVVWIRFEDARYTAFLLFRSTESIEKFRKYLSKHATKKIVWN